MKNNIVYIFIVLCIGCAPKMSKNKQIDSSVHKIETYTFNSSTTDSVFLDLYIVLENRKFVYTKSKDGFSSQVDISINISDIDKEKQIFHQSFSQFLNEEFYDNTRSLENRTIIYKRYLLPIGTHKLFVFIEDGDSKNNWVIKKELNMRRIKGISNILVKQKNNNKYNLLLNNTINSQDSIFCFFQLNDLSIVDNQDLSIKIANEDVLSYHLNPDTTFNNFYCLRLPVNQFIANNPKVEINISDKSESVVIKYNYKDIESIFPDPDLILEIMYYYGFINDYKEIKNKTNEFKYDYIKEYWLKREPVESNEENQLMLEFNSRIQYSIKNFSDIGPGWRSDRGRVLINYGYPNHKEVSSNNDNGYLYLIWYYPSGKKIIFIDQDGFGDYKIYREMY